MSESSTIEQRLPAAFRPIYKLNEHILGATLICYIVGFIITNVYLSSFGIASFDILRVRYILTGFFFLLFLAITIVPFFDLIYVIREYDKEPARRKIGRFLWHYFVVYGFMSVVLFTLSFIANNPSVSLANFIGVPLLIYFVLSLFLLFLYYVGLSIYERVAAKFPSLLEEKTDPLHRFFPWVYGAFFISIIIWLYSLFIYPALPQQIGGGVLARVSLVTSNTKIDTMFTSPATEIFVINRTADTSLFLLVNSQQNTRDVIEIDNGEIEGFKYLPSP